MISFSNPLVLLLILPCTVLAVLLWRQGYANLTPRRLRVALAVRLLIVLALVLSVAGTELQIPQTRQALMVVTDLSASDYGQRSAAQSFIDETASQRPSGDLIGVVDVGRQPVVEQPMGTPAGFTGFQSVVDRNYTNLAGGIDLANALLPAGYQHRVVVVTDGQENVGDAVASARLLRAQGVRVDVVPLHVPSGAEVLVSSLSVPPQLRPQESFDLTVTVHSTIKTTTGLTILRDNSVLGSVQETVHQGDNTFTFPQGPLGPGFHSFTADITPQRDTQPENNSGSAFTTVQSAPRVLVITDAPEEAVNVMASLRSTGIGAQLQAPSNVTPDLAYLQRFAAIVIVDTSADSLGSALMTQLVPYVRDLGHGLVVLGGQNSYSMGGYGATPLEQVLPVSMSLPKHQKEPTTAVALIIESLEESTQINISKEAGKGLLNLLTPQDQIEVSDAPLDGSAGWVVPLQHVTGRATIGGAIDRMVPGDPESYLPMFQSALDTLRHSNAKVKHIILLGDGDAEDPGYQSMLEQIHAAGITVSTVSTNGLGRNDFLTMQNIARWGGGRNYIANDPSRIPQIFLRETRTVARPGVVDGKFFPQELSSNPMLRDIRRVAALYGYIATTPKPAAEIVLASGKLDPVLAAWQYGSGRSVAWTSDASGLWTRDWLRSPNANRFWANLVSWTFPAANANRLFVTAASSQGQGQISVNTPSTLGPSPSVTAHVLSPGLTSTSLALQPVAPGQYAGSFPEGAQGTYFVTVDAHGAGHGNAGQVGLDVSYSPEYRTTGVNGPLVRALAAAGGGGVVKNGTDAWQGHLQSVFTGYDMTIWLLLLAVLLFPVDVAVRRLVVGRRELATIAAAIPSFRRARASAPSETSVGALLRGAHAPSQPAAASKPTLGAGAIHLPTAGIRVPPTPAASQQVGATAAGQSQPESTASKLLAARRKRD